MVQALYQKWRPQRWEDVVGQDHVISTLRNTVAADRVAHALLFAGPRGTGKTTTARLLAKALNCLDPDGSKRPCDECDYCQAVNKGRFLDLIEIDAASNTSVDDVRDLRDKINFSPNQGQYKIYIVDEVHMLSTAAFNAFLKTLEEPPPHAVFILATTEIHKIPATVLSRCQRHEFRKISVNEIVAHLQRIADVEHVQYEALTLDLIARQATGSMRDAISLLDQLASSGDQIRLADAQLILGTATSSAVLEMINKIIAGDTAAGLDAIHKTLDAGSDPRQFARQIVDYLRNVLLVQMGSADQIDANLEQRQQMLDFAHGFQQRSLLQIIRIFNQAANDIRNNWQPALPLELAYSDALHLFHDQPPDLKSTPAPGGAIGPAREKRTQNLSVVAKDAAVQEESGEYQRSSISGGLDVKTLMANWGKILVRVRTMSLQTEALIKSGKLLGVKDGTLFIGFSETLKSKMEKEQNIEIFQQALHDVLKFEVPVKCVVSVGPGGEIPPDIDSDGMVAAAVRDLGGEIVDIQ